MPPDADSPSPIQAPDSGLLVPPSENAFAAITTATPAQNAATNKSDKLSARRKVVLGLLLLYAGMRIWCRGLREAWPTSQGFAKWLGSGLDEPIMTGVAAKLAQSPVFGGDDRKPVRDAIVGKVREYLYSLGTELGYIFYCYVYLIPISIALMSPLICLSVLRPEIGGVLTDVYVSVTVLFAFLAAVIALLVTIGARIASKTRPFFVMASSTLSYVLIGIMALISFRSRESGHGTTAAFVLSSTLVAAASTRILIQLAVQLLVLACRRSSARFPDSALLSLLLLIWINITDGTKKWSDLEFRNSQIIMLEFAARTAEVDIPRRIRAADARTELWVAQRALRIAAALRDYKKWIISPRADTRGCLLERISGSICALAVGEWDTLCQIETDESRCPSIFGLYVLPYTKSLIFAALPLTIYMITQYFRLLALPEPLNTYVKLGTVVWAMLRVLTGIDPATSTTLDSMKDITQLFAKKGKEP